MKVVVLYLVQYDTLLQNATDIIAKRGSNLITKYNKILLQHALGFSITKCDSFIKNYESCYKMCGLLQNTLAHKTMILTLIEYTIKKAVFPVRFISTWKDKVYKYMTAMQKKVCIEKLDDAVYKHNKAYHRKIKIEPINVK